MGEQYFLEKEDHERDALFQKIMHGKSSEARAGIIAMMKKDGRSRDEAMREYFKHFDAADAAQETEADRKARRDEYATLTRHYYNLATDLYEYGWGSSFHFCRFAYGESFNQAIARHEHYLAAKMGLSDNMAVLDVGCGVGGPAREICKFSGANITGLNNNDYQIQRATHYAAKEGLSRKMRFVKGDFMQMAFPDATFDAVYAIEATVHAPSLQGVYENIYRVLKPGGVFGVYEWLMTDEYDNNNEEHRKIRLGIEHGDGISNMVRVSEGIRAIQAAGFELELHEDLADRPDEVPWYYPLSAEWKYVRRPFDVYMWFRMTWFGLILIHGLLGVFEFLRILPAGTQKTADMLAIGGVNLVKGGQKKLFTPMYLMVARKPKNAGQVKI